MRGLYFNISNPAKTNSSEPSTSIDIKSIFKLFKNSLFSSIKEFLNLY